MLICEDVVREQSLEAAQQGFRVCGIVARFDLKETTKVFVAVHAVDLSVSLVFEAFVADVK